MAKPRVATENSPPHWSVDVQPSLFASMVLFRFHGLRVGSDLGGRIAGAVLPSEAEAESYVRIRQLQRIVAYRCSLVIRITAGGG